jgi:hypothetical protein
MFLKERYPYDWSSLEFNGAQSMYNGGPSLFTLQVVRGSVLFDVAFQLGKSLS